MSSRKVVKAPTAQTRAWSESQQHKSTLPRTLTILGGAVIGTGVILVAVLVGMGIHGFSAAVDKSENVASYVHQTYAALQPPAGWQLTDAGKNADAVDVSLSDTGWDYTYTTPTSSTAQQFAAYRRAVTALSPSFTFSTADATDTDPAALLAASKPKNLALTATADSATQVVVSARELTVPGN